MMTEPTTAAAEPRQPYGLRKAIEAIKEAVPVETVANDFGAGLKPSGEDLRGKGICHGGSNESALLVEPDRGRWYCFRCNEGGDVIDLCQTVEGGELWEAVVSLAQRYGVELPRRPERWHRWNGEKGRRWHEIQRWRARRYQRRIYRMFCADAVAAIPDADERTAEARRAWDEAGALARAWAARSMGGAR
ncbi:MAG: CHC2 zinc finger domain-containing protein [Actinomycetota bacterium]|nr:CHC2 zinc finger domain-containing protein [Actinomycetota bacterium]